MDFQSKNYSCGAAAFVAALYSLGRVIRESAVRKRAGTNKEEGTSEEGLFKAAAYYGYECKRYKSKSEDASWRWLLRSLKKGNPVILCVEQWEHWVAAVGIFGDGVIVFDPSNVKGPRKHFGIKFLSKEKLKNIWGYKENHENYFYSIKIINKE